MTNHTIHNQVTIVNQYNNLCQLSRQNRSVNSSHSQFVTLWRVGHVTSWLAADQDPSSFLYGCNRHVVCSAEFGSVVVTTAPATTELNQTLVISVLLNDGSRLVTSYKFVYRVDPTFRTIEPRNHLITWVLYISDDVGLEWERSLLSANDCMNGGNGITVRPVDL